MFQVRVMLKSMSIRFWVVAIELVKPIDDEAKLRLEFGLCQQFEGIREL